MRHPVNSPKKTANGWRARVLYWDQHNQRREITRPAKNKTDARRQGEAVITQLQTRGTESFHPALTTFRALAEWYLHTYGHAPEWRDGRLVAGSRDWKTIPYRLQQLIDFFGVRELKSITHADLAAFKRARLDTPTRHGAPRAPATVNRELSLLHRLFSVARQNRYVEVSPFDEGNPLIDPSVERKRQAVPSEADFARLLAECSLRKHAHIKPLVIFLADTGCRYSEAITLKWADVNLDTGQITIHAQHTKTQQTRVVVVSPRLHAVLSDLREKSNHELVFSGIKSIREAWKRSCEGAGLPGLRIHDLRHYHATRLVEAGVPLAVVGRQLGHSSPVTTWRYANQSAESLELLRQAQARIGRARLAAAKRETE